ncbi:MAG TPA: alcohol dehydrogenase catalytic domain-containing protein [Steroidobacteraceae bacterium]|nr:alcohol dehydrogenase catalytic domain-containing protein [Steroidobacteraceae bacterium]
MRAAFYDAEQHRVSIETIADPRPGPDELLVRVCRCGVCGSDVSMTSRNGTFNYASGRFGHEYAGEVIEVGRNVRTHKRGDRIAAIPSVGCGTCEICKRGNPLLCSAQSSAMFGFGELAVIPPKVAIHLPDSLSFADGAMVEPIACSLHAFRLAGLERGARVLVIGAGSMALGAIYWARALGAAKIAVLSRSSHRRDTAMAMGADAVLGFDADDQARIIEVLGGSPHIVAECVGKAGMLNLAADHVCPGGTVVSMGLCMQAEPIVPIRFGFREVRLLFPIGYTADEFAATARSFDAGRVSPENLLSDVISLDELPTRLDTMRTGGSGAKVQVDLLRS